MKKIITSMAVATIIFCSLNACKKKDTSSQASQMILGKWVLHNIVSNDHFSGADHVNPYAGLPSDIFEFRSDGKLYFTFTGVTDTVSYTLPNDSKITIDGSDIYDIKALTPSTFTIYKKEIFGSDYGEETISWKK